MGHRAFKNSLFESGTMKMKHTLKTDHFQEKSFVSEDNFDEDQWMCWCCNDVLMSGGGVRSLENIKHVWWLLTLRDHDHRPGVNVITPLTYTNICTFLCHPEMICIETQCPSAIQATTLALAFADWASIDGQSENKFHRPNEIVLMMTPLTWVWSVTLNDGGANLPLPACHKSALIPRTI